jgi:3-deoxy-manno-octulosonate cytidylyltransferase (CMP-KDO synthetase)
LRILGVIPARYDSKRFPGKVLFKIKDKPLLQWVYENALRSRIIDRLIIATDDERVAECARGFGAEVFISRKRHKCGSERVAEAASRFNYPLVVNIQGDEISISPETIRLAVNALKSDTKAWAGTVSFRIENAPDLKNPDLVKVIVDKHKNALYFSRSIIPYSSKTTGKHAEYFGHIGVYAFRNKYLQKYAGLKQGPLEKSEKLEQLRILEHGGKIVVALSKSKTISINRRTDIRTLNNI